MDKVTFEPTIFSDAWLIKPKVFQDKRGFFVEFFLQRWFEEKGLETNFIQDNHSKSVQAGVLRGLHWQTPPVTQIKLLRVISGAIYDVIVDLRKKSPTYGQWEGFNLTASNFIMLYIPKGFAHGFCTLEPNTEVLYKVDQYYEPSHEDGIIWNDATLKIDWPIKNPVLSEKDSKLIEFKDLQSPF